MEAALAEPELATRADQPVAVTMPLQDGEAMAVARYAVCTPSAMKITEDARKDAAEHGVSQEGAPKKGMEEPSCVGGLARPVRAWPSRSGAGYSPAVQA